MDSVEKDSNSERVKKEFKEWLKKYNEDLKAKNNLLKSLLTAKQQRNNSVKSEIQQLNNKTILTSTAPTDNLAKGTQSVVANTVGTLKTKSEQLEKCRKTINERVEQESKKIRKSFNELTTRDDITLKPYYEVEEAIKVLNQNIDYLNQQLKNEQTAYAGNQQKREQQFVEINENISSMEPVEKEIKYEIQNANKCVADKLKSLNLTSVEEANMDSLEAKELLNDIQNLKLQLNK